MSWDGLGQGLESAKPNQAFLHRKSSKAPSDGAKRPRSVASVLGLCFGFGV